MNKKTMEKAERSAEISPADKMKMQRWQKEGKTTKEIAALLGVSYHHAYMCMKRLSASSCLNARAKCGRKPKATGEIKNFICEKALNNRFLSSKKISLELKDVHNLNISSKSVRRELKVRGIEARSPRKVPLISEVNKKRRLELAGRFLAKPKTFWDNVVWSDETKINFFQSDGRRWVWRFSGEEYAENTTIKTVKHGGGNLMLWGCMSKMGVGKLAIVEGRMTGASYVRLLQENLFDSISNMGLRGNFVFQQDNDPKHKSKYATQFFEENGIQVLDWPSQSPDLNVIEHMWAELKRRYANYVATSKADMFRRIIEILEPSTARSLSIASTVDA